MSASVGRKIRLLRQSNGHTLQELANRSECSKSYIWELENKNPPRPSADKLAKIAEALGVTTDYLIGHDNQIEDAEDKAFYKRYLEMEVDMKMKLRAIADILGR